MKTIQITSSLSTNLLPEFQNVQTIEIENKPFAEGAFGEVYVCLKVNGQQISIPQVIKLFKEDKSIRAILDYYPVITKSFSAINPDDIKEDVTNLYDNLINNIDEIIQDYE